MANPGLGAAEREGLVRDLMNARRAVRTARHDHDEVEEKVARAAVDVAKRALGERGPVWWDDDAPDFNRHMARNTPYADWFAALG
jgi:hypothetical protein